mmetsp:Transcript_82691/g.221723  ORF Transcript_82691/g.221723 Transcript_82691/m.221723 type:complete len:83 (-) Transcript_82691:50-298(-)|eukprot:CAMPEP_0113698802 /NCGR_PEP_ID=MMETSP0038_2-20120614/22924_1 /TAXON_ID=2898 /ORGANISM="Cryptomonas paramecium" /LENGTH=82 /DNA_ID=CAMNT_0000622029 /DNA_START=18 /DNA_END=266 /DNA_ORIENTATION=+ /assembly_acc=CAM_ASM_000170
MLSGVVPLSMLARGMCGDVECRYVSIGNYGTGPSGSGWPIPPPPPSNWFKGGMVWVYDDIYGNGRRPESGVWGPGEFPATFP